MRILSLAVIFSVLPGAAFQEETPPDRITLVTGESRQGTVLTFDRDGGLHFRSGKNVDETIPVEELRKIYLEAPKEESHVGKFSHTVVLRDGSRFGCTLKSYNGKFVELETVRGVFRIPKAQLQTLRLGTVTQVMPQVPDDQKDDIVITERIREKKPENQEEKKKEAQKEGAQEAPEEGALEKEAKAATEPAEKAAGVVAEAETEQDEEEQDNGDGDFGVKAHVGKLLSFDGKHWAIKGEEKERTVPAADVRYLAFASGTKVIKPTTGWFVRLSLHTGDRHIGTLRSITDKEVEVFSATLGRFSCARKNVQSIQFVDTVPNTISNFLVCDQQGVREFNYRGDILWQFNKDGGGYSWSARQTPQGTVLIADQNRSRILEVDRESKTVIWEIDQVSSPYDAFPLKNGNILVSTHGNLRLAEYSRENKEVVWQSTRRRYAISAEELDNGNVLLATNGEVMEIERLEEGKEKVIWSARVPGVQAWRANRLDNGNTLIIDFYNSIVVEVDKTGKNVVWRKDGLARPCNAFRMDNGNTLILEQRQSRIIEVDPLGRTVYTMKKFSYPQNMSLIR